jgi:hypothetical protein
LAQFPTESGTSLSPAARTTVSIETFADRLENDETFRNQFVERMKASTRLNVAKKP